ncbi:flagellin [Silanimonas sp.]|uniref:flagellin n=1 Tax=Silanimonas sp. TaxID=1929290 RepID=UPI0022BAD1D0|nr:flagellin [Silanimonas sp.]MCZ8062137.1 flagellin [Silanimonas sp.]
MSVINTNTISLNAQRNLSTNSATLATTIQRLSSGLRINSARDDAAGLAISERFSTQIRGLNVAVRNANDGISLAQTAEGALGEVGTNLQRIRELAVQSANATNSQSDRDALNAEVTQLVDEIDRVAKQAEFNSTKLLDGSFLGQLFQVGANAGQAIAIQKTANAQAASLGGAVFDSEDNAGAATGTATAAATITGISVTDSLGNAVAIDDVSIAIGDTGAVVTGKIVAAINAKIGETGVLATADGTNIDFASVRESVNASGAFTGFIVNTGTVSSSTAGITLASAPAQNTTAPASAFLDDLDISSVKGAGQALAIIDKALTTVNGARADLGAVQNRFQSVVANLNTSAENLTASRSRIRDADYAKETAELTRTQILQQAGTAMLAQANQIPQNVLSLLR